MQSLCNWDSTLQRDNSHLPVFPLLFQTSRKGTKCHVWCKGPWLHLLAQLNWQQSFPRHIIPCRADIPQLPGSQASHSSEGKEQP